MVNKKLYLIVFDYFLYFELDFIDFRSKMEFVTIPNSKFDDVIQHLRYNFPDEPLNASVGLCVHGKPCELLEHHDLVTLKDGFSIMALDNDKNEVNFFFFHFC